MYKNILTNAGVSVIEGRGKGVSNFLSCCLLSILFHDLTSIHNSPKFFINFLDIERKWNLKVVYLHPFSDSSIVC